MTQTITGLQLLPEYRDVSIEQVKRGRGRWYKVGEQLYPPVTSILDIIDKSGPLVPWARRDTLQKVGEELQSTHPPGDAHDYHQWINDIITAVGNRPKDQAATEGQATHALIAEMLQGGSPLVPDDLAPAVRGAREFVADYGLSVVTIEVPVWHPTEQYAGTVDFVGRNGDGHLVVADWKRSSGIYPDHGYQITAYADAIEAITGEHVSHLYVVRLPKEGGEDAGYECREVLERNVARRTFMAAHQLWAAHRNAKEMW